MSPITTKKTKRRVYTKKNYMSGDGMMTSVWGPVVWHMLHTMSFNYPVNPTTKDKKKFREFILLLVHVLPCKHCRINLEKNLKQLPLTLDKMESRDTFSRYIYELHEIVNHMLKKESGLTYCDVRERYENFRARCLDKRKKQKQKKEDGCTEPLWNGVMKSKCVLHIVPKTRKMKTFKVDSKCVPKKKQD